MSNSNASVFAMFPGQGSQKLEMGKEIAEKDPRARAMFELASETLKLPLYEICVNGPLDKLTMTEIAQPAILTVSSILFKIWAETVDHKVVVAAGHSLGEYSALVAAGSIDFADAVALVNRRGRYMQEAVPVGTGKMVAVLGKEVSDIERWVSQVKTGVAEIANINATGQIVVSGDKDGINEFMSVASGAKLVELNVSAPFHSSLMKSAEERLRVDLSSLKIAPPKFPVMSNYSAEPLTDPEAIREALALQVCGKVRWVECVINAASQFDRVTPFEFGEGTTLTGLLKRIDPSLKGINIGSYAKIQEMAQNS